MINPILTQAILIGILASVVCGIIGPFVVVKRISFMTGSIAHAAFGGVGIGYFLGINPLIGAVVFGSGTALIMGIIRLYFAEREDTLIGAIWAVGMAIGILFVSITPGYATDLMGFLFGNILLTGTTDIYAMLFLILILVITIFGFYRSFQLVAFDETYARTINLPVTPIYLILLLLIAFTVVTVIRIVGIILVVSLVTLPAAASENWSKTLLQMIGLSIGVGIVATTTGIGLSYWTNAPAGPLIIFVLIGIYGVSLIAHRKFSR